MGDRWARMPLAPSRHADGAGASWTKGDVVMDTNGDQGSLEEARKDEVLLYERAR